MNIKSLSRKQSIKLVLFFVLVLSLTLSLIITGQTQTLKLKVTIEIAEMREKPDINSPVMASIPSGTVLESHGKEGEWYKVNYK